MIAVAEVQALLAPLKSAPFRLVGLAGDFMKAAAQLQTSPSLFVLPSENRAGKDQGMTGLTVQRVTQLVSTVIGVNGAAVDAKGGKAIDQVQDYEQSVIDALVGKQAPSAASPFIYVGGKVLGIDVAKGTFFWGSTFAADFYLRK